MKKKKFFFLMWSSVTSSARYVAEPCQFFFHMSVTFFNLGKKGGFSRPKKTKKKEAVRASFFFRFFREGGFAPFRFALWVVNTVVGDKVDRKEAPP
jgi:hypothetical protein